MKTISHYIDLILEGYNINYIVDKLYNINEEDVSQVEIISKYVPKNWLKSQLNKKNYEGPNGNKIIGYYWASKEGFVLNKDGEEVPGMVSDWDKAEICTFCKHKVVHVFYVWDKQNDKVTPFGFDHAHKALGIAKEFTVGQIGKIKKVIAQYIDQENGPIKLKGADQQKLEKLIAAYDKYSHNNMIDAYYNSFKVQPSVNPRHRVDLMEALRNPDEFIKKMLEKTTIFKNSIDGKFFAVTLGPYSKPTGITKTVLEKIPQLMGHLEKIDDKDFIIEYMFKDFMDEIIQKRAANTLVNADKLFSNEYPYTHSNFKFLRYAVNYEKKLIMRVDDIIPIISSKLIYNYDNNNWIGDIDKEGMSSGYNKMFL